MKLNIDVTANGTTETVTTVPADLVAWEAKSGRSVGSWSEEAPSFTDVAFLAWRGATRGQNPRPKFESWIDSVDDLTLTEVGEADPTQAGA